MEGGARLRRPGEVAGSDRVTGELRADEGGGCCGAGSRTWRIQSVGGPATQSGAGSGVRPLARAVEPRRVARGTRSSPANAAMRQDARP